MVTTIVSIVFIHLEQKINSNHMKMCIKVMPIVPQNFEKILKYNQGQKSMKIPFVISADTESLLEKIQTCDNSPEKSLFA